MVTLLLPVGPLVSLALRSTTPTLEESHSIVLER